MKVELVQNFVNGVVCSMPHGQSHKGNSQHFTTEMEDYLNRLGSEVFNQNLKSEHENYIRWLREWLMLEVEIFDPNSEILPPDSYYVCDSGLVAGGNLFLTTMGPASRKAEPGIMDKFFKHKCNRKFEMKGEGRFEGGDNLTFCLVDKRSNESWYSMLGKRPKPWIPEGKDQRTNGVGRKQFANFLSRSLRNYCGYVVGKHNALHLGSTCEIAQVGRGEPIWLICSPWFTGVKKAVAKLRDLTGLSEKQLRYYVVPEGLEWFAPVLSNGNRMLIQDFDSEFHPKINHQTAYERLTSDLEEMGFSLKAVPWTFHQLTDGNFRCALQPLPVRQWMKDLNFKPEPTKFFLTAAQ